MRSDSVKSSHWKLFYPGECYAGDLAYREPVCEREVRADVRERHGVTKLPAGTYVEPGSTMDWYNALSPGERAEQQRMFETR
jgi:hypothetical protein